MLYTLQKKFPSPPKSVGSEGLTAGGRGEGERAGGGQFQSNYIKSQTLTQTTGIIFIPTFS